MDITVSAALITLTAGLAMGYGANYASVNSSVITKAMDNSKGALSNYDTQKSKYEGKKTEIDTFRDEAEESARVAAAIGARLDGVRLDRASELGGVTPELVAEVRAALERAGVPRALGRVEVEEALVRRGREGQPAVGRKGRRPVSLGQRGTERAGCRCRAAVVRP